jgi:DNA-directed RNA polymerase specialized sigma24 family protein
MASEQFWQKFEWAAVIVLRDLGSDLLREEVTTDAEESITEYLLERGLSEYTDRGEGEFGGWLFALCRRHLFWARGHVLGRRGQVSLAAAAAVPGLADLPEAVYASAWERVQDLVASWQGPLATVMDDYIAGVPRERTAEALGISENWVSQLRTRGRQLIEELAREVLGEFGY